MDHLKGGDNCLSGSKRRGLEEEESSSSSVSTSSEMELLKQALLEAKAEINRKDDMITQLMSRLDHFVKAFPDFEGQLEELKSSLEEEKRLWRTIQILKVSTEEASKTCLGKQDDVANLVERIEKMNKQQIQIQNWGHHGQVETGDLRGGVDAALILPEEIWELIFGNLTGQKDLRNCSNTCALFKKVLQHWKKPTWEFMQVFPLLFQYLPRNMYLKCRSVSKGWNMVVDDYFENHPSLRPYSKDKFDYRMLPFVSPTQDKFQSESIFKFGFNNNRIRFPNIHGRNPFIGRVVTLTLKRQLQLDSDDDDDVDELNYEYRYVDRCNMRDQWYPESNLWTNIRGFLDIFGKHIWYLTLDSSGRNRLLPVDNENIAELMTIAVFSHALNLRKLRILPSEHEDSFALQEIDIGSLPEAPYLETIEAWTKNVTEKHAPLVALLKRHHSTLRVLYLSGLLLGTVCDLAWPNLVELHLDHLTSYLEMDTLLEAGNKGRIPSLRKLGVNLVRTPRYFDKLLTLIHRLFGTTSMTTLRLHGGIDVNWFPPTTWKSCMVPTLKTLEVEHVESCGFQFYLFLRYFPFVENVHVYREQPEHQLRRNYYADERKGEEGEWEVDVHKFIEKGRMYQYNIWELLPRLKLFTFRWDVYTRAGYEQFKERHHHGDSKSDPSS